MAADQNLEGEFPVMRYDIAIPLLEGGNRFTNSEAAERLSRDGGDRLRNRNFT